MTDKPRLIEAAFPLKQASLNSVHEKSVRHGHISTLHIWPARRPLAASRAALIAALLDDPGTPEGRRQLVERIGGKLITEGQEYRHNGKKKIAAKEQTVGGVLHWGQESSPDIDYFRQQIHQKFGRPPRVLDPFSGGGAIPLEAMRLGCEAIAVDINPVAWFILKCTLEYPHKLVGQKLPLPDFAVQNRAFMEHYYKRAEGLTTAQVRKKLGEKGDITASQRLPGMEAPLEADLSWHVRAWGLWILEQAKKELKAFYPLVDGKTSVAYLWARTVQCKNCRANIPLLKTRWLVKKGQKQVVLTLTPKDDNSGVDFGLNHKPSKEETGEGTMSKSGVTCPCCNTIMTMNDIRAEGKAQRLGTVPTAVIVEGDKSKEYRLPTPAEVEAAAAAKNAVPDVFADIPYGLPTEPTPGPAGPRKNSSSLPIYGFYEWKDIFSDRQLLALGVFIKHTRRSREVLPQYGYATGWTKSIFAELAIVIDKLADYNATLCIWHTSGEKMNHVFGRYALPVNWDFAELNPLSDSSGNYIAQVEWLARAIEHIQKFLPVAIAPQVINQSAISISNKIGEVDLILTDPPYYDAIMYSDIMDFFYIWLRRTLYGLSDEVDAVFAEDLSPKWNHQAEDGELIDDPVRFGNDKKRSKQNYEDGMFRVFKKCHLLLSEAGRMVIVFANKAPDAWETLVSAIIRAGFVVEGSWPIQTEMSNRMRANASAALSSSIWLVCHKRPRTARPGWDNNVIKEMQTNIIAQLREFWDAGIRGPDFVWAATGPAMEAYSQHPVVKKANEPDQLLTVPEFLTHVRRIVVDFVVGRVLSQNGGAATMVGLDDVTNYYLLHRYDYSMADAPINAVILYAMSCGLSDSELMNQYHILQSGNKSDVKLVPWAKRSSKNMGYQLSDSRPVPLIDKAHRLLHLWKAGELNHVDDYLDVQGIRRDALFAHLLQALIELASAGSEERALLESISNHLATSGGDVQPELFNPVSS